ncbi:RNA transcription, translation and transport factor protein-like [Amphiura filiformis]|uniref:RNA transcription, translation and transport factor protein-like n=1 Tax=Amphiura filiformis TaxID=82378 RepID=UPI003B2224BD
MFKRKLEALAYHQTEVDVSDETQWRNLVVFLEDQKIRFYKIEEREGLRNFQSKDWPKALTKYLKDLECPADLVDDRHAACDWLLAHAVRLEYGEHLEKYKDTTTDSIPQGLSKDDPFGHMDVNSPDFKAGLASVCQMLNIPRHPDPTTMLQAVSILIKERLSDESQVEVEEGVDFDLKNYDLGFETKDYILDEAAKVLRLLHISELRDLQTKINEAIVAVQTITANPKTDQRLGKVGR